MRIYPLMLIVVVSLLTGCRTMMTPEQHKLYAKDLIMLDACSNAGLISPDLAARGMQLYRHRGNSVYKYNEKLLDESMKELSHLKNVNNQVCRQYSVSLVSDLMEADRQRQSYEQFNQSLQNLNQTINQSKPTYTNCYRLYTGGVSCTSY